MQNKFLYRLVLRITLCAEVALLVQQRKGGISTLD